MRRAAGAGSAVTFSSLYEDEGDRARDPARPARTRSRVAHGMAMCGGNGMGFMNLESKMRATGFLTPEHLRHGPVTFLSHSGSAFSALAFNDRGIGFNLLVSSGQEVVTTMADYMDVRAGADVDARARAPARDRARPRGVPSQQLAQAAELGVPVLALKVGRTEASQAMVTAHSGALAGEHGAYEALFAAYGVHEMRTLDEMADTMELFSAPRRVARRERDRVASTTAAASARCSSTSRPISTCRSRRSATRTLARIRRRARPRHGRGEPARRVGDRDRRRPRSSSSRSRRSHDDPEVSAIVFCIDMTHQGEPYNEGYLQIAIDTLRGDRQAVLRAVEPRERRVDGRGRILRDHGIPVLEGTDSGLRALRHLLRDAAWRAPPAGRSRRRRSRPPCGSGGAARLTDEEPVRESDGLQLLADYGIATVAARPGRGRSTTRSRRRTRSATRSR